MAIAGPAANLFMAILWTISLRFMGGTDAIASDFVVRMAIAGININLVLMALNLLPLPPLDGGRIVFSLLPASLAYPYSRIEPYGMVILILLLVTGSLWMFLSPFLLFGEKVISWFL